MLRTCDTCKQDLDLSEFNLHRKRKDGLQTQCRKCNKARARTYYQEKTAQPLLTCKRCLRLKLRSEFVGGQRSCRECVESAGPRQCTECGILKDPKRYKPLRNGDTTAVCIACLTRRERKANPQKFLRKKQRYRRNNPANAVLHDCRSADQKKNRPRGDLDLDFVREQLAKGCQYCGETEMRITLDRIDNTLEHSKVNVVPACLRCNYLRGSMPFEAWLNLVPAVRQTRELGLFGSWRSQPFNRKVAPNSLVRPPDQVSELV